VKDCTNLSLKTKFQKLCLFQLLIQVSYPPKALWHFRLGHLSNFRLALMNKQFPFLSSDETLVCDTCHFAKQNKLPFCISTKRAMNKFDILHFDIWGPLSIKSIDGHSYFLTVVDDYSRFVWIILLKSKYEV